MDTIKKNIGHLLMLGLLLGNIFLFSDGLKAIGASSLFHFAGMQGEEIEDKGRLVVANNKMNLFYIGIGNPLSVAACGIAAENLELTSDAPSVSIIKRSIGTYIVHVDEPGLINLQVKNTVTGKTKRLPFRVKRIHDPVVKLCNKRDGSVNSGEFRAQMGLIAAIENFDIDARCAIQSYTMYYSPRRGEPIELRGEGGRFKGAISSSIKQAKPGDSYAFTNVLVRCPGDKVARRCNGLMFTIR